MLNLMQKAKFTVFHFFLSFSNKIPFIPHPRSNITTDIAPSFPDTTTIPADLSKYSVF